MTTLPLSAPPPGPAGVPSGDAAARLDRPDRRDDAALEPAAHRDIAVVQVDGRVAMSRHQPDRLAELRQRGARAAGADAQDGVLVADVGDLEARPPPDARRPGIDGVRLVPGVDDRRATVPRLITWPFTKRACSKRGVFGPGALSA